MSGETDSAEIKRRLFEDTPYWAEKLARVVTKEGELVPLKCKPGQLKLDRMLEEQREAGKPQRAIALKARQVGISTYSQAKLLHRATLRERCDALTVAQDRETGAKLYRMAERMYQNLPDDPILKPKTGRRVRQKEMHFVGESLYEAPYPDSRYLVDTAGEDTSGRGGTYRQCHFSEVAFWPQIAEKLNALLAAVPKDPDSLVIMETTANGFNEFKDWWDDAEAGRSDWIAFFWPWFEEEHYRLKFVNETEREEFIVGDEKHPYAEEEPELVKEYGLDLEQLHWRRQTIANDFGGDLKLFKQEMPANPLEAFISTGSKVFDSFRVAQVQRRVDDTDPLHPTSENPGPEIGDFQIGSTESHPNMKGGTTQVPKSALWVPREKGVPNQGAPWKLWLSDQPSSEYIVAVDVSGGQTETTDEPDYHAIQVIDQKTREQVAEYRSRIDPDEVADQALLAALYFKQAWIGVEVTGGWGGPVVRILYRDYHYPFVYRSQRVGQTSEKTEKRLGFSTDTRTKPLLIAGMAALLREEADGIRSRNLAGELSTYTRDEKGATGAESGKYDDLLMAYMIGQHLASSIPLRDGTVQEQPARETEDIERRLAVR